jgi:hypothetical protein
MRDGLLSRRSWMHQMHRCRGEMLGRKKHSQAVVSGARKVNVGRWGYTQRVMRQFLCWRCPSTAAELSGSTPNSRRRRLARRIDTNVTTYRKRLVRQSYTRRTGMKWVVVLRTTESSLPLVRVSDGGRNGATLLEGIKSGTRIHRR